MGFQCLLYKSATMIMNCTAIMGYGIFFSPIFVVVETNPDFVLDDRNALNYMNEMIFELQKS